MKLEYCEAEAAPDREIVPDMKNLQVFSLCVIYLTRREWKSLVSSNDESK
jgi:hypothetical protein